MDTKWKVLSDEKANLGISQGDMYQMYAYQKKYNATNVTLLYPQTDWISGDTNFSYHSDDNVTVRAEFIDLFDVKNYLRELGERLMESDKEAT
jgi:5-methylcytosine-specific restriction enzyme subunit McrC